MEKYNENVAQYNTPKPLGFKSSYLYTPASLILFNFPVWHTPL